MLVIERNNTMKKILILLVLVLSLGARADYTIEWSSLDGGGGTSSGGDYSLTGTIGQADAGEMSGGDYNISGGFWVGGVYCFVDLEDFAKFAEYWLETGTGLPADLYEDEYNIIDMLDLQEFLDEWLYPCPTNWPL